MLRRTLIATCCLGVATIAFSQEHQGHHGGGDQPYAGLEQRAIKALSDDEISRLESGAGMGFAQAAELNHYPGPKHVMEMADELGLTAEQMKRTRAAFDTMNKAAIELGANVVAAERHLDSAFADGSINEDQLAGMTGHIASLRGQLRAVHLRAHLEMKKIMTEEQVEKYDELRGYGG